MKRQNVLPMTLLFLLLLFINDSYSRDSFLKETLNNKETKPIQKISETDQNSNEFENRTLATKEDPEIFVNMSKEINKIFHRDDKNSSVPFEEFAQKYISSTFNKNLSLKISPEFLIFDENNEIEMVLQNNTKGSNNSIMKQNQTMDEFSFENLLSKGKNYFFLMKKEIEQYNITKEVRFRAGVILIMVFLSIICMGIFSMYAMYMAKKCNLYLQEKNQAEGDDRERIKNNMKTFRYYQNTIEKDI